MKRRARSIAAIAALVWAAAGALALAQVSVLVIENHLDRSIDVEVYYDYDAGKGSPCGELFDIAPGAFGVVLSPNCGEHNRYYVVVYAAGTGDVIDILPDVDSRLVPVGKSDPAAGEENDIEASCYICRY